MLTILCFITILLIGKVEGRCSGGTKRCQWNHWKSWGSCDESCGGGYRTRSRSACCNTKLNFDQCMSSCGMNSDDAYGYGSCNAICYHGYFHHEKTSDWNFGRCICNKEYGGSCCDEALCGWNGKWCWPGYCGYRNYERYCTCDSGFQKEKIGQKTMCQLARTPTLKTCRAGLENANGDAVNTTGTGECSEAQSVYTNLQPHRLSFKIDSKFSIFISRDKSQNRIKEYAFGIVSNVIELFRKNVKDTKRHLSNHEYNRGPECDNAFSDSNPRQLASCTGSLIPRQTLQDGESICLNFIPYAGGQMTTEDGVSETYKRTHTKRELCFMYDNQAPQHCTGNSSCSFSMLHLSKRITRNAHISVSFSSWSDPVPRGGSSANASGMKKFVASFLRVEGLDKTTMVMKYPGNSVTEVNAQDTPVSFTLPTEPALYAVLLEVHDVAGNVRMTRRFVLYDNSSTVAILSKYLLKSTTASHKTNYTWQIHHDVTCLNWTGRYYNTYHTNVNLLRRIKADGNISSSYDQTDGLLSVSGTPNIDGIVRFEYTWKINEGKFRSYSVVADLNSQAFCENLNPTDGETYTFRIKPVDINSRFLTEDLVVHIDRSPPNIDNIWLVKDGYRQLFVHNSSDLSRMYLQFEALDLHSGLHTVEWNLGTTDGGTELGTGSIGVQKINGSCTDDKCYCPKVGSCEDFLYTVNLNSLVDKRTNKGQHNRIYYFSVIVTNSARLVNIEHLDVLADDSPPEQGIVQEGVPDSPDIDYTSESTITVNWNGFIDHESGIKFYRIGLSNRCLTSDELTNSSIISKTTNVFETITRQWKFHAVNDGHYISSIIAFNNAMESSKVVCSDGITKDSTVPSIENVTLKHSKVMEIFACDLSRPYLVKSDLTKIALIPTNACLSRCTESDFSFLPNLPEMRTNSSDMDVADHICTTVPVSTNNWYIYTPSSKIDLSWVTLDSSSQIRREEVGIASDPSAFSSPDIEVYRDTHGHARYHNVHGGLDRGVPFYMMIRSTNKAGLENVLPLGPIIIDDTPPEISSNLQIHIDNERDMIACAWNNDTFIDPEQKHAVDKILFKIGAGDTFYTPILQIPPHQKCIHPAFSNCVHYPLNKLQRQDEEMSLMFFFELYVYNMAEHFTTARSPTFILPSRFPPGHGRVFDVDPSVLNTKNPTIDGTLQDVDVHFSLNEVCAVWRGFNHHQNVTFQIGIGTRENCVDIIPYKSIESTDYFTCFNSSLLLPFTKYFVTVKATCSGGSMIASSDGITILDERRIEEVVRVNLGVACDLARQYPLAKLMNGNGTTVDFVSKVPLVIGHGYTIESKHALDVNKISSNDVLWMDESNVNVTCFHKQFRAFRKSVTFTVATGHVETEAVNLTILDCFESLRYIDATEPVPVELSLHENISVLTTRYQASVYKDDCTLDVNGDSSCLQKLSYTDVSETERNFQIGNLSLLDGKAYRVGVSVCVQHKCLQPLFSPKFYQLPDKLLTSRISAFASLIRSNTTCLQVEVGLEWSFDETTKAVYDKSEWAIALSPNADGLLTTWFPFNKVDETETNLTVKQCIDVKVYLHRPLYACVKTMRVSGATSMKCTVIEKPQPNEYDLIHIYELEANNPEATDIEEKLHAEFLGETLKKLQRLDLDFCRKDTVLIGAIPNADERNITWYVLMDQNIPEIACEQSLNCVKTMTTVGGYANLHAIHLIPGSKYYLCASSNQTVIHRELFDDVLEELNLCGNGFIIDDVPPKAGHVMIMKQHQCFLKSMSEIIIAWYGFEDRLTRSYSNSTSSIYAFSYAIGSSPGGEDVVQFTKVGLGDSVKVSNLCLRNGGSYYATVRAWDHVNFSMDAISSAVRVDISPPTPGVIKVGSALRHQFIMSSKNLHVHWNGFTDTESGIDHFYIGIGDQPGVDNMLPFMEIRDMYADLSRTSLWDGLHYYATLKAVNRAGLWTTVSSEQFVLDSSPPVKGVVRDGSRILSSDIDYQNVTTFLMCHWEKFNDPHSGVLLYRVGLGTDPGRFDTQMLTGVGLRTEFTWKIHLIAGVKYFVTVEACNGAGLCTREHSDGIILDDSPPFPGIIHVGISGKHESYQSHRNSISAHWTGFEDPHSDIHHFEWCLTLQTDTCDILPFENILLSQSVFKTQLNLPLQRDIYVKVKAYNNVGMSVVAVSDSFKVDETHPFAVQIPHFELENMQISHQRNTQWDNSLLRIRWKYRDEESPIVRHVVRLTTHHDGKVRRENIILGNEDRVTIQMPDDDPLLDGDRYWVTVTACNAAGLCTNSTSQSLLIDSSAPLLGGFKPPLKWQNHHNGSRVNLTWYGFSDIESGIKTYMISVGQKYSASDISNGIISIAATGNDEQNCSTVLTEHFSEGDSVILSIWAINGVGLRSDIGKVTVTVVQTEAGGTKGILKLQKHSCVQEYCNRDCTCAVVGGKCEQSVDNMTCITVKDENMYQRVNVFVGMLQDHQEITASSSCLSSHWVPEQTFTKLQIQRYEWSVGIHKPGDGVFDGPFAKTWFGTDLETNKTFCMLDGLKLVHGEKYKVFVNAWYSESESQIFSSPPVTVDTTPPDIVRGKYIFVSADECASYVNFVQNVSSIQLCWHNVFKDRISGILKYYVMAGTTPNGDDLISVAEYGLNTNAVFTDLPLQPGTKYFFTVRALNKVGLITSLASNGIVLDLQPPYGGVVFNTHKHRNVRFLANTNSLSASWHGFGDHHSFIHHYSVWVTDIKTGHVVHTDENVGIKTLLVVNNTTLQHSKSYNVSVKAWDAAGYESETITSEPFTVDVTPPQGFQCKNFSKILEYRNSTFDFKEVHLTANLQVDNFYKLYVILDHSGDLSSVEVSIGNHFMTIPLVENADNSKETELAFLSPYNSTTRITANFDQNSLMTVTLTILLFECTEMELSDLDFPVDVRQISHSRLSVCSRIIDPESGIRSVEVGVGTTEGGFQIYPLSTVPVENHIVLEHGSPHSAKLFATVVAHNNAGIETVFSGTQIIIDHTPAEIHNVTAKYRISESENKTTAMLANITVNVEAMDTESEVKECTCVLDSKIVDGELVSRDDTVRFDCEFTNISMIHGEVMTPVVVCINNVQLITRKVGPSLKASFLQPSTTDVHLEVVPVNDISYHEFEIHPADNETIQSNRSMVQARWSGFRDVSGIDHYEYTLREGVNIILHRVETDARSTAVIVDLSLKDGCLYSLGVEGVNVGGVHSDPVFTSFKVQSNTPQVSGDTAYRIYSKDGANVIDWTKVFVSMKDMLTVFEINVGSREGYCDIINRMETMGKSMVLPKTDHKSVWMSVCARYKTGNRNCYYQTLII